MLKPCKTNQSSLCLLIIVFLKEACYRFRQGLQSPTVLFGYLISSHKEQSTESRSAETGGWTHASARGLVSFTNDFICSLRRRMALWKSSAASSKKKERRSLHSSTWLAATKVAVKFGGLLAPIAPKNLGKLNDTATHTKGCSFSEGRKIAWQIFSVSLWSYNCFWS